MLNCKFIVPVQSVQFAPLLMGTAQSGVVPCVLEWVRSRCLMSLLGSEFTFWVEWLSALVYVNPNIMTKRLNTGVLFLFPLEAQHLTKGIGEGTAARRISAWRKGSFVIKTGAKQIEPALFTPRRGAPGEILIPSTVW